MALLAPYEGRPAVVVLAKIRSKAALHDDKIQLSLLVCHKFDYVYYGGSQIYR